MGSGIESIFIPSTLKEIDALTFADCEDLMCVEFSEGLEKIGIGAFTESGIENIVLPTSTRIVCAQAFGWCKQLHSIRLNDGLEVLGGEEQFRGKTYSGCTFAECPVESIAIPSTLRVVK